jgi:glycosyltransferase involved in cell wall biosynthesis
MSARPPSPGAFVSVVMPAYEHERYVVAAIDSVRAQTFAPAEIVVVDDGSTDRTPDLVEAQRVDGMRVVRQENRGAHAALNRAIELSRGAWIAILDSDDLFAEGRIEQAMGVARATGAALVIGSVELVDEVGAPLPSAHPTARWYAEARAEHARARSLRDGLRRHNVAVTTSSFFLHRSLWRALGGFRPYRYVHDYDFLLRAVDLVPDRVVFEPALGGVRYRVHGANTITENVGAAMDERRELLRGRSSLLSLAVGMPGRGGRARRVRAEVDAAPPVLPGRAAAARAGSGRRARAPLRCGIVVRDLEAGGLEEAVALLARTLPGQGLEPHVLCTSRGGAVAERLRRAGVPVEVARGRPAAWRRWLDAVRPQVVASHFGDPDAFAELSGRGVPVVEVVHNVYAWLSPDAWAGERDKATAAGAVVAVSDTVARHWARRCGIDTDRVRVVPNAVHPGRACAPPAPVARRMHGFDPHDVVFVGLGRYGHQKNQAGLLEAFAEVAAAEPRARLLLAGSAPDPSYLDTLRREHRELLAAGRLRLEPATRDPASLLAAGDAYVSASLFEGWSVAASEAMWIGLPLLLTDCGGARALVGPAGERGCVVPNPGGHPEELDTDTPCTPSPRATAKSRAALVEAMTGFVREREAWRARRAEIRQEARRLLAPERMAAGHAEALRGVAEGRATAASGLRRKGAALALCLGTALAPSLLAPGALAARQTGLPTDPAARDGVGGEVCTRGHIEDIAIRNGSVFDPGATGRGLLKWAYGMGNLLHVRTRTSFIRGELLFEEGDCLDPFLLSESQRLLDSYGFLASARVWAEPTGDDGGRRVVVETRDEWSTRLDVGASYTQGLNLEKLQLTERNFIGQGILADVTRLEFRSEKTQSFGLSTPRLFGRTDAGVWWGSRRAGRFFAERVSYPFVAQTGRVALLESFTRGTSFFSYAAGEGEGISNALAPMFRERLELGAAGRFGPPRSAVVAGVSLTREVVRYPRPLELVYGGDFDRRTVSEEPPPEPVARQLRPLTETRVSAHVGLRHYRNREYVGLDAVRDRQTVGVGYWTGVSLGRAVPLGADDTGDVFARMHSSMGVPLGSSLLHGGTTVEARHQGAGWHDVLAEADLVAYLRNDALPGHTFLLRASGAGGWRTTLPYQLTLGGRDGVRSLYEDAWPGGRQLRFVVEDRIALPWPRWDALDLGLTLFGDAGRMWRGDVPYGADSPWLGAAGFGLRVGFPSGTRNVLRPEIVFPVGPISRSWVFRITYEFNRMRDGYYTPELARSRRFDLGPERF